ncbi:MAG: transposase [Thermoguttaceae bacterium]
MALYAKGMTARDIQEIVLQLYDVEVSAELISEITADLDKEVAAWRTRPLDEVWPIVYFDGIVVHVRGGSGHVAQHTIYVALIAPWVVDDTTPSDTTTQARCLWSM